MMRQVRGDGTGDEFHFENMNNFFAFFSWCSLSQAERDHGEDEKEESAGR